MSPRQAFPDTRERLRREAVGDGAHPVGWAILKDALRRPLTASERECISDLIELQATFIARARASRVTSRDIKRTLGALAGMRPDEAANAYVHADNWTRTHVAAALRRAGIFDEGALAFPDGEQVVSAAKSAIASIAGLAGRGSTTPNSHVQSSRCGRNSGAPSGRRPRRTISERRSSGLRPPFSVPPACVPAHLPTVAARLRSAV